MAITMSESSIKDDERQSLLSSSVDTSIASGGATPNTASTFAGPFGSGAYAQTTTGKKLAGVTASFASNVSKAIDQYCADVDTAIETLSKVEVNTAFKGSGIEQALNNFIESVKTVAKSYTDKLKTAESEIINSVAEAYQTQDTDISGNLGSDASSLEENKAS